MSLIQIFTIKTVFNNNYQLLISILKKKKTLSVNNIKWAKFIKVYL